MRSSTSLPDIIWLADDDDNKHRQAAAHPNTTSLTRPPVAVAPRQEQPRAQYPDHYTPASDKVRLCRDLRNRKTLSPKKLNDILDCLEGVDRLQGTLVRARRELRNLAIFGSKDGRKRGEAAMTIPGPPRFSARRGSRKQSTAPRKAGAGSKTSRSAGRQRGRRGGRGGRGGRGPLSQPMVTLVHPDRRVSPEIKLE
ncbi:uncharacterized protein PG986_011383 [Apiospora aurea]|uniref:Uncharacterized protein n=1 Tax=Apiospora aurea TaxID=335848 RepID=A0ABR1Q550_9PEZI